MADAPPDAPLRRYARLLPQHYHSYPPDYRRQWSPWRLHAMRAAHFEIEEREEA